MQPLAYVPMIEGHASQEETHAVLIIYYCVTDYHYTEQLKTADLYYLTQFLRVRQPGETLLVEAGVSGSVMTSQGHGHLKVIMGLRILLQPHSCWQRSAPRWLQASVLMLGSFAWSCSKGGKWPSPRNMTETQNGMLKREATVFDNLIWK